MAADSNTGYAHGFDPSSDYNFRMLSFQNDITNITSDISSGVMCSSSANQSAVRSFLSKSPDIYSSATFNAETSFGSSHHEWVHGLKHDRGLSVDWTYEEQNLLNEGLIRYVGEGHIMKYIKIAALFPKKSARDVALRIRWLVKHGIAKRHKLEEHCAGKRINERKEKMMHSYGSKNLSMVHPSGFSASPMMYHAKIKKKNPFEVSTLDCSTQQLMDCSMQQLMDETYQILGRIATNLGLLKELKIGKMISIGRRHEDLYQIKKGKVDIMLQDNIDLFCHTRNIFSCLSSLSSTPGTMSQMPPLPISVDDELLQSIFPQTSQAMPYLFSSHGDGDSVLKEETSGGSNLL